MLERHACPGDIYLSGMGYTPLIVCGINGYGVLALRRRPISFGAKMGMDNNINTGGGGLLRGFLGPSWEIIESQAHFLSYNYFRLLSQSPGQDGDIEQYMRRQARRLKIDMPPTDPVRLAERWIAEMDRYGVSRACLLAGLPGDEHSVIEALRRFPDRFIGFVVVNPHLVVAEEVLEHVIRSGGIRGICLYPCRHRFQASDELVYPIYHAASRHRLTVYVCYGSPVCPVAEKWGVPDQAEPRFNNPGQLHFAAADFPTVPFVVTDFLEEHVQELLRLGLLCPNVHVRTPSIQASTEESELSGNSPAGALLEKLLKAFGPKRMIFGTGSGVFPPGWRSDMFPRLLGALKEYGLTNQQIGMILSDNLKRILRLGDSNLAYLITL